MALFAGHGSAHGTHGEPESDGRGKMGIKRTARTLREPVTVDLWQQHLDGTRPLGVICIREDSTCSWGSIDYDVYDGDVIRICAEVDRRGLPLVPCRSKSGGLHLFLFATEAVPADTMRAALSNLAAQLGIGSSEIFPKQTQVLTDRGDIGNWIVMPYYGGTFGGKLREQVGLRATGAELTAEEFCRACEGARQTPESVESLRSARVRARRSGNGGGHEVDDFSDGPPCLQHLAESGFPEGGRNNALFMIGVYERKRGGDWKDRLEDANRRLMHPPLQSEEVVQVVRGLSRKDYQYTCKTEPMCSHCDSSLCRTREYGVGQGDVPVITSITKLGSDPPIYFADVCDVRMRLDIDELFNYQLFRKACLVQGNFVLQPMKERDWTIILSDAISKLQVEAAPPDSTESGAFIEMLEEFCTNRSAGSRVEDLLRGVPWHDEDEGHYLFRLKDVTRFVSREGAYRDLKRAQISRLLREAGAEPKHVKIKGRSVCVWTIPDAFLEAPPEIPTPTMPAEPM